MQETKERFFSFVDKLKAKLNEFSEAAISELIEVNQSDTDECKSTYLRMKSAVLGQIESIRKKADEVMEDKIIKQFFSSSDYYDCRDQCYKKVQELNDLIHQYREKIEQINIENYEIKYQKIVEEYENIKDKFRCTQCGTPIFAEKIFFTSTYITCSSCQTKNTFEPSSQAKQLEQLGRSLAEQRTAHLLKEYEEIPEKSQALYLRMHELKLSIIQEKDNNIIAQKTEQIQKLEQEQKELEEKSPYLYRKYLRAMFDEWNKINPDMQAEHEKFHNRLLNDYNKQVT